MVRVKILTILPRLFRKLWSWSWSKHSGTYANKTDPENETCEPCPYDTYSTNNTNAQCSGCPGDKGTLAPGSDSQESCQGGVNSNSTNYV